MQKLLKKQDQLALELLALLYLYNGESLSIVWCMDTLGETNRRVLVAIIENLSNKKNMNFHIQYSKKNVKAIFFDEFSLDDIYHDYYKNSVEIILLDRIFEGKVKNLVEYSTTHFYSYSTLYRKIQKLNLYFSSDFKITVGKNKNIPGKEQSIRCYYASLYNVLYGNRKMKFQKEIKKSEKYLKSIQINSEYLYSKLTFSEQISVIYYFTISRLRMEEYPIKLRPSSLKNSMFEEIVDNFDCFTEGLEVTKKQKKIERNWLLFYFLTTMQLNQKDNLSGYFNQKIFENLYKNESKPAEWLTHFNQCVGSNFSESEQTVMEFRLYQKIYQHVYFSKVVESLYQNPEKREASGRVKSVTYKVQSWYENAPFKKQLIHHGITIDVIVDLVLEHTDFLKRSKKIYIGTKKGRHWDQYLAKQLLTTELAEQITVVENWAKTTDFVIVDQKIPVLPAYKTFIISKNPSLKELENIQKELQKLLA